MKSNKLNSISNFLKKAPLALLFFPALAFAHTEDDAYGFVSGFTHPILGYDHLLAMLSVGILSAQLGGRYIWIIPSLFVSFMLMGGILGAMDVGLPFVELGIALSVIVLGVAIVYSHIKQNLLLILAFTCSFGTLHGHAHGVEMPSSVSPVFYSFGFMMSTASIHLVGVFIGHLIIKHQQQQKLQTYLGSLVATAGCYIFYTLY
ncbi:MAG: HupE/UreJ family protein [Pseudomonadales bacterium]